jgi:hypothetical protein
MTTLTHQDSIVVAATPEEVYAVVSDVTRTGEWSPICTGCRWDEGQGPEPGAWFTGHNETPSRTWETRSQVLRAVPGREFTWSVASGVATWGYHLRAVEGGTELTETWEFGPTGAAFFEQRYGDDAAAQVEDRRLAAVTGIPKTLSAIKRVIEG